MVTTYTSVTLCNTIPLLCKTVVMNMSNSSAAPSVVRRLIGAKQLTNPTYGWCRGHLQANISIVPASVADDFERFCELNSSACPLLYRSKPGEVTAPVLAAEGSDIRTQLPKYWHFKDGRLYEELTDLTSFDWEDMVTFYLGCSFGMEDALQNAGIQLPEKNNNVSMYVSNITCHKSGPFLTNMVVSMRAVPLSLLQALFEATYTLDCSHGAPIHIGDPSVLGISNIRSVDFGEPTDIAEDEVPVFFACGVTGNKAIEAAGLTQCFAHKPGHMFICDITTAKFQDTHPSPHRHIVPCLEQISQNPKLYSVLSKTSKDKIIHLEKLLLFDIGERGIKDLVVKDDFLKCSLRIYQASSVGITFGFPVFPEHAIAEETDGIPGAIALAKALLALNKNVGFIIDKRNETLLKNIVKECLELNILKTDIPLMVYDRASDREEAARQFLYPNGNKEKPRFDHLVSIERTGPSKDGTYRNMKAQALNESLVAPVEDLFLRAEKDDRISTTSIGDGGNELGMGKVRRLVEKHVPHGELIACTVSADYLITAGVSNWGGNALAVALHVLSTCPIHARYVRRGLAKVDGEEKKIDEFLNSTKEEAKILQLLVDAGVRDGRTGKAEQSVDGFQFYPYHAEQIEKMQAVING